MHVSLKHARRVVLGVAVGALLLAAAPGSGQADIIQLCVSQKGKRIILPLGATCNQPNRAITFDSTGVVGPSGIQGSKGQQGPQGPTGTPGQMGPQGPVGPAGAIGMTGNVGATGPLGPAGEMGPQGPEGATGPTGPTGATGPSGVPGINGTQFYTLGGGDLGSNVELLFGYQSVLGGPDAAATSGTNPFCFTNGVPNGTCSNSPIYYGPGNGADTQLESVAVPIDASTVTQLWVQTKNVPGPGQSYTFQLCINSDCWSSPVRCTINLPTETECNDLVDTQKYTPGDTIALKGTATEGAAATEVSWTVVVHQTGGDIPTPPTP